MPTHRGGMAGISTAGDEQEPQTEFPPCAEKLGRAVTSHLAIAALAFVDGTLPACANYS